MQPFTSRRPLSNPSQPAPQKKSESGSTACPRCGAALINPESLGICQRCGYCRSLEEDQGPPSGLSRSTPYEEVSAKRVVGSVPSWAWVLGMGAAAIVGAALIADRLLPPESFRRAMCGTAGLAAGVLVMIGVQIYAVLRVSAKDPSVGGIHFVLFLSPRVWKLVLQELPATRWLVCLNAWAVTSAATSVLIVGGMLYWLQYWKPPVDDDLRKAAEARDQNLERESEEAAVVKGFEALGKRPELNPQGEPKDDIRPTVQCVVIGYIPDDRGRPTKLILATLRDSKLTYCGTVDRGLAPQEVKQLKERFATAVRLDPIIKGVPTKGIWVKPGTYCEIHQSGFDEQGRLVDPSFGRLRGE
jgi:hypothetical protein